jgi:hypothetical protein
MVRAKFVVTQVTHYERPGYAQIELESRYSKKIDEDIRFAEATPNGKLSMLVTNPRAIEYLKPGKVFYIDIMEAPEGTSSLHE